jgi:aryl-alcohol dehydrogenase-like predicted oxidoreductase
MGLRGPKTWGVRDVDDEQSDRILNAVLDAGINFIDTSPDYGMAEQRIGNAISSRRSEYYLATKCGCVYTQHSDHLEIDHVWSTDVVKRNLETSLRRLQTDYIDLLQFHGGSADELQQAGLIDLLQDYRDQGIIRCIGVSSKLPNIADLIVLDVFDSYQVPYSCLQSEHEKVIQKAAEIGAGVIVRGGIAHGGPDAEIDRPALRSVWESARLDDVLPGSMTRSEMILRYTLSNPHCHTTIVGTCNQEHLEQNVQAAIAGPLERDLILEINERISSFGAKS